MIDKPILSLIEPPGFCDSNLTYNSQTPVSTEESLSIGVFPIKLSRELFISI